MALWVTDGKPRYSRGDAVVVFISDVGGAHKVCHVFYNIGRKLTDKTFFIIMCCFTSGFYILSLFAERWLRHVDRLPVDIRKREKIFGTSSCLSFSVWTKADK
jgi:hypothetical protein